MSMSSNRSGQNIVMKCDICGRQTKSLRKVNGHWINPTTKRKVTDRPAWVCKTCFAKIAKGGGK